MFMRAISAFVLSCLAVTLLNACGAGGEVAPPASPQAKAIARNQAVELSWPVVEGAVQYNVYYSTARDSIHPNAPALTTSKPEITIGDLQNNTVYYFAVTAIGAGGESLFSPVIETKPRNPPASPQNVVMSPGNEAITLSWQQVPDAESYNIYLARSTGIRVDNIRTRSGWLVIPNVTSPHLQTGLLNGVSYFAVVTAVSSSGESSESIESSATPTSTLSLNVGNDHACAILIDNTLWCWGSNKEGQVGDSSFNRRSAPVATASQQQWKSVSAGTKHSCGISLDDTLWCWGFDVFSRDYGLSNNNAEPIQFDKNLKFQLVLAGNENTCAFSQEEPGKLNCWGSKSNLPGVDILQDPIFLSQNNTSIGNVFETGVSHSCGISVTGKINCWGDFKNDQTGDELENWMNADFAPEKWQSIAVSRASYSVSAEGHSCAINDNEDLWCWGGNSFGQVGIGLSSNFSDPAHISPDKKWKMVALGGNHSCGIQSDNSLWCWGHNERGQLGLVIGQSSMQPTQVNQEKNWRFVSAYGNNTCASKLDGSVWCTGYNNSGQLGSGSSSFVQDPVKILENVDQLTVSNFSVCAHRSDKQIYCWGSNDRGSFGLGHQYDQQTPTVIADGIGFLKFAMVSSESCGVTLLGQLKCAGAIGKNRESRIFIDLIDSLTEWKDVAVGIKANHCAIKKDNSVWCLETDATSQVQTPKMKLIDDSRDWQNLVANNEFVCAIDTESQLGCWGKINWNENLGLGDYDIYDSIKIFHPEKKWLKVAIDGEYVCAIDSNKKLWCWGSNEYGQFGNGSTLRKSSVPLAVLDNDSWLDVAVNTFRTCGVKENGSLWCWGLPMPDANENVDISQLLLTPQQVGSETDWSDVEVGSGFICAIKSNKEVYCWGLNGYGQIGNGQTWRSAWEQVKFEGSSIALQ